MESGLSGSRWGGHLGRISPVALPIPICGGGSQASVLAGHGQPASSGSHPEFAGKIDRLVIVEELDPVIEQAVRGQGFPARKPLP